MPKHRGRDLPVVPPLFTATRPHRIQTYPDAVTGVPVAGLRLMPFTRAAPRPFSASCIPPAFTLPGSLWGPMRKPTLLFTAYLPMLGINYIKRWNLSRDFDGFSPRGGCGGLRSRRPPVPPVTGGRIIRYPAVRKRLSRRPKTKTPQPWRLRSKGLFTSSCGWPSCAARGSGSACGCADSRG